MGQKELNSLLMLNWDVWNRTVLTLKLWRVTRSCRIHHLLLYRRVRTPHRQVSCLWDYTIWWWCCSNAGALGNAGYPFFAVVSRSPLAQSGSTWWCHIDGSKRTKLFTNAKLRCLKSICFDIETVRKQQLYLYKTELFEMEMFICI